jgi:glyoxylate reductase
VSGATLGIVGFGRIGQAVAKRAQGFDMRILYYDVQRYPEAETAYRAQYADLETVLRESDFVSIHTVLSKETYHYFDDAKFKLMKSSAVLINTSRGPVVDPAALHRALTSGTLAYAALDVTEPEPINLDSPLLALDNIIIAPHIASASFTARNKMATMAAANLSAGLKGERLPNCVNPEVYG